MRSIRALTNLHVRNPGTENTLSKLFFSHAISNPVYFEFFTMTRMLAVAMGTMELPFGFLHMSFSFYHYVLIFRFRGCQFDVD